MKFYIQAGLVLALITLLSCTRNETYKTYNDGKVYYTDNVTEQSVDAFGQLLIDSGIFDGSGGTFKLDFSDSTFVVSTIAEPEQLEDIKFLRFSNLMRMLMKDKLFPENEVVYQLCNSDFKVLKSIAGEEDVVVGSAN